MLPKIAKDTIILLSSGEYSDYSITGLAKATQDIDPNSLKDEYVSLYPDQMGNYSFSESKFIEFLKEKKLLEGLPFTEWYLSSYSRISEMRVEANGPMLFT